MVKKILKWVLAGVGIVIVGTGVYGIWCAIHETDFDEDDFEDEYEEDDDDIIDDDIEAEFDAELQSREVVPTSEEQSYGSTKDDDSFFQLIGKHRDEAIMEVLAYSNTYTEDNLSKFSNDELARVYLDII